MLSVESVLASLHTEQLEIPVSFIIKDFDPVRFGVPPEPEYVNSLRADIELRGMRRPLLITGAPLAWDRFLITGHQRYEAAFRDEDGTERPDNVVPVTFVYSDDGDGHLDGTTQLLISILDNLEQGTYTPYFETVAMVKYFRKVLTDQHPHLLKLRLAGTPSAWPGELLRTFAKESDVDRHNAATEYGLKVDQIDAAIQSMLQLTKVKQPTEGMQLKSFVSNRLPVLSLKHDDLRTALAHGKFPLNAAQTVDKITDANQRAALIELAGNGMGYRKLNNQARTMLANGNAEIMPADPDLLNLATQARSLLRKIPALHRDKRDRLEAALQTINEVLG